MATSNDGWTNHKGGQIKVEHIPGVSVTTRYRPMPAKTKPVWWADRGYPAWDSPWRKLWRTLVR
jgi:hypothetical protein